MKRSFPAVALLMLALSASAMTPWANYQLHCMGCHGPQGEGQEGRVPALRVTIPPLARSPQGRRFLVQIPGVARSSLSDRAVAELLNWMERTLGEGRDSFVPFSEAEVRAYRATPLIDINRARVPLIGCGTPCNRP